MDSASFTIDSYFLCALIIGAVLSYARDDVPMEFTAMGVVLALLVYFHIFPILDETGQNLLSAQDLLAGFANPALISVLALLVVGQGVSKSGILDFISQRVLDYSMGKLWVAMLISLATVLIISAFLNNIPVVIIFIPIIQSIAQRFHVPASKLLIPLSFMAVVGGMTTLVGSGTNLLVSNALSDAGFTALGFFEFTVPGLVLAGTTLAYVMLIAPRLLPMRTSLSHRVRERSGRYFLAEVEMSEASKLLGERISDSQKTILSNLQIRMLHRLGKTYLPPFSNMRFKQGDVISVASSRTALTEIITSDVGAKLATGFTASKAEHERSDQIIVEMMVTPSSTLVDQKIGDSDFERRHNCHVLGFQHRSNMVRSRIDRVKLSAGDMLLVRCDEQSIKSLRNDTDIVLVEYSIEELPNWSLRYRAMAIFLAVILCVSFEIFPIIIAALLGAMAMITCNVVTLKQAIKTVDVKIVSTIAAALALGAAMGASGTANALANLILVGTGTSSPQVVLSAFFLAVAIMSNLISTKTCAVLFAPIGLEIGMAIGIDPRIFAITIVFAANCAFATPFAYQTSLLVMGPGSYKFTDFLKAGTPLVIIIWLVFTAFVPWYYGL